MNILGRAAIAIALIAGSLALALPATASTHASTLVRLPAGSHGYTTRPVTHGSGAFERLYAKRKPATAHFSFPYALATDAFGDLFVANAGGNSIVKVGPKLNVAPGAITQSLSTPFSLAVDTSGDIYAGNATGNIPEFNSSGTLVATYGANASYTEGIAVDQYQDLYITSGANIAVDDVTGASLFSSIYNAGQQIFSLAFSGPNFFGFYNNTLVGGNGSVALRTGGMQFLDGPLVAAEPTGSACNGALCWYDDTANSLLFIATIPGSSNSVSLPYQPAGIAYDAIHKRLFVADPVHNAIQVYNPTTLALGESLT